jgi:hypothetical protein
MNKDYKEYKKAINLAMAEHTRSTEQLEYLLAKGDPVTKVVAMFNPAIGEMPGDKLAELKKDKNPFVSFAAEYIEKERLLRLDAHSIDGVADKKIEEEKRKQANYKKLLRVSIN